MSVAKEGPKQRRPYAPRMPLEQRRTEVLDAALRVIGRDGYSAISMEGIAREAGVTKPVVYGAYPQLTDLLGELLDRTQTQALSQLLSAMPKGGPRDPATLGAEIAVIWAQMVKDSPDTWVPILLAGETAPPVVLQRIEQGRDLVRSAIVDLLGGAEGPYGARNQLSAHALIAVAEHIGRLLLRDPESVPLEALADLAGALSAAVTPSTS